MDRHYVREVQNRSEAPAWSVQMKDSRPAACLMGAVVIALTVAISLTWSSYKLLWWDEFLAFWTDTSSNLSGLVEIQRKYPISLDPLVNHWMASFAMRIFTNNALALRLPSLFGYIMMQVCLFCFVGRIATSRAALVAMSFPVLTTALYFSAEGRPYGMMLGLCALVMVCWQTATRRKARRSAALIGLAAALALLLNTHYAAVLLIGPIFLAELVRTIQRKTLDFPVIAAMAAGAAGIVFTIPFMEAASDFRPNYSTATPVSVSQIAVGFRETLTTHIHSGSSQLLFLGVALVVSAAVLWACWWQSREKSIFLPAAEAVLLAGIAAMPFLGYLLAVVVTHDFESRYVVCSVIGMSAFLAISVNPVLRYRQAGNVLLVLLFTAMVIIGAMHVIVARELRRQTLEALQMIPPVRDALLAEPSRKLFFQNPGEFAQAVYYEPDAQLRSRMTLVYSRDREVRWNHRDTISITAMHLRKFTQLPIVDWESVTAEPGQQLFTTYKDPPGQWSGHGWNWTDQAFAFADARVTSIGRGFRGEVVWVSFPAVKPSESHP